MKGPYSDLWVSLGVLGAGGLLYLIGRRLLPVAQAASKALDAPQWDPVATKPSNVEVHKAARPVVVEALTRLLGRAPTLAEIQYGQAIGWHEGRYGRGWKGAMVGSNNWGAVQCAKNSTADCTPYEDSYADGTKYEVSFRRYATPTEGAQDMLRHVFIRRPNTARALSDGDATVFRASYAMRRERYYEGHCPQAKKRFGAQAVRASLGSPDRDDATRACAEEATRVHAKLSASVIATIAGACGDPGALRLGSWEDADTWYRKTFLGSSPPAPAPASAPSPKATTTPDSSTTATTPATSSTPATPTSSTPSPATPASSTTPATTPKLTPGLAGGRLLEAVKSGAIDAPTWIEVPWTAAGVVVRVSADALRAPVDGKLLRLPVTWRETLEIAARLHGVPLTAELSDAIWAAAGVKIDPRPLGEWGTPEQQKQSSKMQPTVEWAQKFSASIDNQIGTRAGELAADVGKDWIFSPRLALRPQLGVTYGWRYKTGKPIQGLGPDDKIPAHNDAHYDYSQTLRLVQRNAVDGTDLLTVYEKRGLPRKVLELFGGAT